MKENEVVTSLEIRRVFSSDQLAVFDALTKPEIIAE